MVVGSVYPWKEVFQGDKSAIICSREARLEQYAGDMPCIAHLLLSQHRKTDNVPVEVAALGIDMM